MPDKEKKYIQKCPFIFFTLRLFQYNNNIRQVINISFKNHMNSVSTNILFHILLFIILLISHINCLSN